MTVMMPLDAYNRLDAAYQEALKGREERIATLTARVSALEEACETTKECLMAWMDLTEEIYFTDSGVGRAYVLLRDALAGTLDAGRDAEGGGK